MTIRLFGIMAAEAAQTIVSLSSTFPASNVSVVPAGRWCIITGKPRSAANPLEWMQKPTKKAGKALIEFQKMLESLQNIGPILPVAFGTEAKSAQDAVDLLKNADTDIARAFSDFGNRRQYQITVSWDPEKILTEIKNEPESEDALAFARQAGRIAFGQTIQILLERRRAVLKSRALSYLEPVASEIIEEPVDGDRMALNLVVLIDREDEPALETSLEAFDAGEKDLMIRMIGPLPAVSFSTVRFMDLDTQRIKDAYKILDVEPGADSLTLKAAYRAAMRRVHPDAAGEESTEEAAGVAEAYKLLKQLRPATVGDQRSARYVVIGRDEGMSAAA